MYTRYRLLYFKYSCVDIPLPSKIIDLSIMCGFFVNLAEASSPWMVFEYMAYGDLTEVLRNNSDQFSNYSPHLPILDSVSLY